MTWTAAPVAGAGLLGAAGWWAWRHQHSAAVAAWAPGGGIYQRAGPLQVRTFGSADLVVVLLHGMIAAGNSFGATYDMLGQRATVVVPDLLGFGGSMIPSGRTDASAHIHALDAALAALGLEHRPTIVAGHSMGGALALRWAAEHTDRVRAAVTFGAPLYRDRAEADRRVAGMGRMEALLAGDGPLPRAVCRWMCRHRAAASWIAVAIRPDLPVPVARSGVKHTWNTYTGSLNGLIRDTGWQHAVTRLGQAGTPVILALGEADRVTVPGQVAELADTWPTMTAARHPTAGHSLPLTDPTWCARLVADAEGAIPATT